MPSPSMPPQPPASPQGQDRQERKVPSLAQRRQAARQRLHRKQSSPVNVGSPTPWLQGDSPQAPPPRVVQPTTVIEGHFGVALSPWQRRLQRLTRLGVLLLGVVAVLQFALYLGVVVVQQKVFNRMDWQRQAWETQHALEAQHARQLSLDVLSAELAQQDRLQRPTERLHWKLLPHQLQPNPIAHSPTFKPLPPPTEGWYGW